MGSISEYAMYSMLDLTLNGDAFTAPATYWIGLSTSTPTAERTAENITEPAGNGYAREEIGAGGDVIPANLFSAAASRAIDQNTDVTFASASGGGWGTITHWFICNHATNTTWGTNVELLAYGAFNESKVVNDGNTPSILSASGDLNISFETTAGKQDTTSNISDYLALEWLDHLFRAAAYSDPAATYAGLSTDNPMTSATTGTTVTEPGNGYNREVVNNNGGSSPTWDQSDGAWPPVVDNTHLIQFDTPSGTWGTVRAVFIVDAATNGNILFFDTGFTETPDNGDDVNIPIGSCDISVIDGSI